MELKGNFARFFDWIGNFIKKFGVVVTLIVLGIYLVEQFLSKSSQSKSLEIIFYSGIGLVLLGFFADVFYTIRNNPKKPDIKPHALSPELEETINWMRNEITKNADYYRSNNLDIMGKHCKNK
ncbi:MAG TPA: hypothetical protein P5514_14445 [Bacteroidales bacterium]|nr:hypothetical protein [Bacteroidales bacterium]HRX98145.1 hypothetical protein [Bacteroidales bacterium]